MQDHLLVEALDVQPNLRIVFLIIASGKKRYQIMFYNNIHSIFNIAKLQKLIDENSGFSISNNLDFIEKVLIKNKLKVAVCLSDEFVKDNILFNVSHGKTCFKPFEIEIA